MQNEKIGVNMDYGFNVELAQKIGVNEAIVVRNFQFWLQKNKANNKNFCEGRFWTYNSLDALCKIFPFWSKDQIRNILKKLTSANILIKGNFNKNIYDKTVWYSISDEILAQLLGNDKLPEQNEINNEEIQKEPKCTEMVDMVNLPHACGENPTSTWEIPHIDMGNPPHRCGKIPTPIPDINTDSKPCDKTHTHMRVREISSNSPEVDEFCEDYKAIKGSGVVALGERVEIAKVLTVENGYDKEFWCAVFKKSLGGWQINENGKARKVPCGLKTILQDYGAIYRNEKGLEKVRSEPVRVIKEPEPEISDEDRAKVKEFNRIQIAQIKQKIYK